MIRVLGLGAFLMLASCGMPSAVKCTTANCSGCCTEAGECLGTLKQSPQACGGMGAVCRVCLPQQLCLAGACIRNPDAGVVIDDAGSPVDDAGQPQPDSGVSCGAQLQPCCGVAQSCFLTLTCQRGVCDLPMTVDAGACGALGQACCTNSMCTGTSVCSSGTCVAPTVDAGQDAGVVLKPTGAACALDRECIDGACLVLGFANGYCTKACTTSIDCVAGSQCGNNPSGVGPSKVCLKQCTMAGQSPGGCRTSYVCEANAGTSGVPVCFPGCTSSTMCGAAPTCDARGFCCGVPGFVCCENSTCQAGNTCTSGSCQAAAACGNAGQACCGTAPACLGQTVCQSGTCTACGALNQACCASNVCSQGTCMSGTCQTTATQTGVGTACASFSTCAGGSCFTQSGTQYQGGYCSQECTSTACPGGSSCSPYLVSGGSYCLQNCTWDGGAGGCRANYVCDRYLLPAPPSPNPAPSCISACTTGTDCPLTGQCSNGFCCGKRYFRCCGTTCSTGTCTNGYCL